MQEQWTKWEPVAGLARKYYIESISEAVDEEFKIILSEQFNVKNKVHIVFKNPVEHRCTNKSFRHKTIDMLDATYGTDFYEDWTFFKVVNSEYVKWLSEESYDIYEFQQCSLIAADSILDIDFAGEPAVTFVNLP